MISGEEKAVGFATKLLKEKGAKRVVTLNTNGPFHTNKLEKAKIEFAKELEKITIRKGKIPVIKNIDGIPYTDEDNVKEILTKHMVSPIRFDKAIEYMNNKGIENYVEIGPGRTLTGFIKKTVKNAICVNINDVNSLEEFLNE